MSNYDNNNTGALFKNDRKEHDKQPDYTGSCEVDGVEYYMSAWIRESKNGKKFFSLAYTAKDNQARPAKKVAAQTVDIDDDLPF